MEQVYTSKIDTWLGFVLLGAVALCVIVFVSSLRDGSVPAILTTLPILLIGAGLPIWLLITTRCTLSNSALLVRCAPFKWYVPLEYITCITATSNPLSSPALSLDRLRIDSCRGSSIIMS